MSNAMILCNLCKGTGWVTNLSPFGFPTACLQCRQKGKLRMSDLRLGDHCCLFHKNRHSMLDFSVELLSEGLKKGECAVYVHSENALDEVMGAFEAQGIHVGSAQESGALKIAGYREAYFSEGKFDAADAVEGWRRTVEESAAKFKGMRAAGEASWILNHPEIHAQFVDYEERADDMIRSAQLPFLGVCQYNENKFEAEFLDGIRQAHSISVLS